jgi:hypothetical protein
LGVIPEFSFVKAEASEDAKNQGDVEFRKAFYEYMIKVKSEAALGFNPVKLLGSYTVGYEQIGDLTANKALDESIVNLRSYLQAPEILQFEEIQFGLRFGNYKRKNANKKSNDSPKAKPVVFYDFYAIQRRYIIYENNTGLNFKIQSPLSNLFGYGISIWNHNIFRFNYEFLYLPITSDDFVTQRDRLMVNLGFSLCLGRYY